MNNNWNDDTYDEYETIYQNSLMMVEIIEENRNLKMRNAKLEKQLQQYQVSLDKQYQEVSGQVGSILTTMIEKSR